MSTVSCVFCGHLKKKAKEHVFADWLLKDLQITHSTIDLTHFTIAGKIKSNRTHTLNTLLLGQVCNECNNGWMATLENKAKTILQTLLNIQTNLIQLDSSQCHILSLWAYKTVLALNNATNYRHIVPDEHYKYLYKNKDIPPGIDIDFAFSDKQDKLACRQNQSIIGFANLADAANISQLMYKITICIGNLLFCVAFCPIQKKELLRIKEGYLRIWPINNNLSSLSTRISTFSIDDFDLDLYYK